MLNFNEYEYIFMPNTKHLKFNMVSSMIILFC